MLIADCMRGVPLRPAQTDTTVKLKSDYPKYIC